MCFCIKFASAHFFKTLQNLFSVTKFAKCLAAAFLRLEALAKIYFAVTIHNSLFTVLFSFSSLGSHICHLNKIR